jgi:hypothetical protein
MIHPYEKLEGTVLWKLVEAGINGLLDNDDIKLKTKPEYVIGYLCENLSSMKDQNAIVGEDSL